MKSIKFNFEGCWPIFSLAFLLVISFTSCRKFIEVEAPYTSFSSENVYTTDATAIAAVTSIYGKMSASTITVNGIPSVSYFAGLSADELTLFPSIISELPRAHYTNSLTSISANAPSLWSSFYPIIYQANAAIEGLNKSTTLSNPVKQQLIGEATFVRAFCYFYLVNLYGDVPLVLTANFKENSLIQRSEASSVWQRIISDLQDAKSLLNEGYLEADLMTSKTSTERIRPNKWTAQALLARTYLYLDDYTNAESQSTEIINNSDFYKISTLNNAFLKSTSNNLEAIWQLQPVNTGWNTEEARVFILPATGPSTTYPVYLNKRLINIFEATDKRRTSWITSVKVGNDTFYYAWKYKSATLNASVTEYNTVFRLSEQYLIRAEARTHLGNMDGAVSDINVIRNRAGLDNATTNTMDKMLDAISRERRLELFTEWGNRWFDLKRTNTVDEVMNIETPLKGGSWESIDKLYPIPASELIANPNLTQTPGY